MLVLFPLIFVSSNTACVGILLRNVECANDEDRISRKAERLGSLRMNAGIVGVMRRVVIKRLEVLENSMCCTRGILKLASFGSNPEEEISE